MKERRLLALPASCHAKVGGVAGPHCGRGTLSSEAAAEAALSLLGNASAHISRETSEGYYLNKKVHPLAEEEEMRFCFWEKSSRRR